MRVFGWQTLMRNESKGVRWGAAVGGLEADTVSTRTIARSIARERFEDEHACWDPKDGELCLSRMKSGETLMEVRSGTDVQIVRLTWV